MLSALRVLRSKAIQPSPPTPPTAKARAAVKRNPIRRKIKATTEPFFFPLAYFQQTLLPVLKETSKTIEIKMPDKLQAVEQLAKLCGGMNLKSLSTARRIPLPNILGRLDPADGCSARRRRARVAPVSA
jgi:hypothetical protein